MKKILPISVILVSLLLVILQQTAGNNRGHIYSTVTQAFNDKPILRVVSHEENCSWLCGSIHVFQSFQNCEWKEIKAFRHDDPIEFPNNNIKVHNENFAYFWLGWEFAVSNDGGKTWAVWNPKKDELMKNSLDYGVIENVIIEPSSGKGKMFFNSQGRERAGVSFLKTEDFGKTWHR